MLELYERAGDHRLEHQRGRHGARRDPRARDAWASPRSRCSWSSTPDATTRTCRGSASTTTASCCGSSSAVGETGLPLMVHPHDQALMTAIEERYWERGERDFRAYARAYAAHDGIIWDTAAALLLRLQTATGTRLHLLHTQTRGRRSTSCARRQGRRPGGHGRDQPVGRVPRQRLGEHRAARAPTRCPTTCRRPTPSRSGRRSRDGTIDLVSTDHAPHTREEKEPGWTDGWKAHTGTPSTQFYLPLLLDASADGRITLERIVERRRRRRPASSGSATRAASRSARDADIAIVDLDARVRDHATSIVLSKIGWTPYAGRRVRGAVEHDDLARRGRLRRRRGRRPARPGPPGQPTSTTRSTVVDRSVRRSDAHGHPLRTARPALRGRGRPGPADRGRPARRPARASTRSGCATTWSSIRTAWKAPTGPSSSRS